MELDKTRYRFQKSDALRFLSHHDLMRTVERMLRRAQLPFKSTEGFHPTPRMVFAQSLSLGLSGYQEVLEVEWLKPVEPDLALQSLQLQAPVGLIFVAARRIPFRHTARIYRMEYQMMFPSGIPSHLPERLAWLQSLPEIVVERIRPTKKNVNLKPMIREIRLESDHLVFDIWSSQEGTVRADELIRLLQLEAELDAGSIIRRTQLWVHDEADATEQASIPTSEMLKSSNFVGPAILHVPQIETLEPVSIGTDWGASPNGPIVE